MRFEFASAGRIVFGEASARELPQLAASLIAQGRPCRALVVTGSGHKRLSALLADLAAGGIECVHCRIGGEPTVDDAASGVELARQARCELVIAVGGGSVLDAGKAVAALLTNGGEVLDYLEVVGRGRAIAQPSAPLIAVPTTAGTGAEVTRNAVLSVPSQRVKVSMRSAHMLPRVALVDPELTYSLPPEVTASTGLDALTQLLEAFVSNKANALTDAVCREGLGRAARSLARAWSDGRDAQARRDMALASLCGGLALANAALGAVHGFAGPLGGMLGAPHGTLCASLLPAVMRANVRALKERQPRSPALGRYRELAAILAADPEARLEEGIAWVERTCAQLRIPSLRQLGLGDADAQEAVSKVQEASSMKGNPLPLERQELARILAEATEGQGAAAGE